MVQFRTIDDLAEALHSALHGHRCATAWLGFGNALFLGFGPVVLRERTPDGLRTTPPYEVQSSMADWRIGDVNGNDEPPIARSIIEKLVGASVADWRLESDGRLTIHFANDLALVIIPCPDADPSLDQWWICGPDMRFAGIAANGQVVVGDVREWASPE